MLAKICSKWQKQTEFSDEFFVLKAKKISNKLATLCPLPKFKKTKFNSAEQNGCQKLVTQKELLLNKFFVYF